MQRREQQKWNKTPKEMKYIWMTMNLIGNPCKHKLCDLCQQLRTSPELHGALLNTHIESPCQTWHLLGPGPKFRPQIKHTFKKITSYTVPELPSLLHINCVIWYTVIGWFVTEWTSWRLNTNHAAHGIPITNDFSLTKPIVITISHDFWNHVHGIHTVNSLSNHSQLTMLLRGYWIIRIWTGVLSSVSVLYWCQADGIWYSGGCLIKTAFIFCSKLPLKQWVMQWIINWETTRIWYLYQTSFRANCWSTDETISASLVL